MTAKKNIKASLTSYLKFEFNNYENLSQIVHKQFMKNAN